MASLVEQVFAPAITAGRDGSQPDPAALEAISRTLAEDPAILRECPPAQLYLLLTEAIGGRRPDAAMQVLCRNAGRFYKPIMRGATEP